MSTTFHTTIDTYINPAGTDHLDNVVVLHSAQHSNLNDAVEAVEAKVGVDFSSTTNTLDFITNLVLMTWGQHPLGGYRETTYVTAKPFVDTVIWYTSSLKTIKLVEKTYTYAGAIPVLPSKVTLKLYDGTVANTLKRTIEDTFVYDRVFETSRTRIIT